MKTKYDIYEVGEVVFLDYPNDSFRKVAVIVARKELRDNPNTDKSLNYLYYVAESDALTEFGNDRYHPYYLRKITNSRYYDL